MITETSKGAISGDKHNCSQHRFFKIIKQNHQHLILTDGNTNMIFKTYTVAQPTTLLRLQKRKVLSHPNLLNIHKIETRTRLEHPSEQQPLSCGILFEKYQKTLAQSHKEMDNFSHDEIFQTFYPIKEVLEHLATHQYDPGHLTLKSIVCTEDYEVKLMEDCLQEEVLTFPHRPDFSTLIFEELASLLFNLLFPTQKHILSWKSRFQIAEIKLSSPHLAYFQGLCLKFAPSLLRSQKTKKIRKNDNKNSMDYCKRSQRLMKKSQNDIRWQEGKQNKIIQ